MSIDFISMARMTAMTPSRMPMAMAPIARRPPRSSRAWLPVSATEWMASASIDDAPVKANPMNLAMAKPRLAKNAARIALVPWEPAAMLRLWLRRPTACRGRLAEADPAAPALIR